MYVVIIHVHVYCAILHTQAPFTPQHCTFNDCFNVLQTFLSKPTCTCTLYRTESSEYKLSIVCFIIICSDNSIEDTDEVDNRSDTEDNDVTNSDELVNQEVL